MGRPVTHTEDRFLDAAAGLFATGAARAVTMNAVARAVGAPSGSIFHRFPTRGSLLAALWLRTVRRFHQEYLEQLGSGALTVSDAVAATTWVVDWCRANLSAALILHAGVRALEPETWPEEACARWDAMDAEQGRVTKRIVREIARAAGLPDGEVAFVLFDMPLAIVRRPLSSRQQPGPGATKLARNLATRLLAPPTDIEA